MTEWINTKDKLPNKDGKYLIIRKISPDIRTYSVLVDLAGFTECGNNIDEWDLYNKKNIFYKCDWEEGYYALHGVEYWLELPEPPKEYK